MGSLMAGWDSPVLDSKTVELERNRSLTKEEIESFWKLHKKFEEDQNSQFQKIMRQSPKLETVKGFTETESIVDWNKVKKADDWWTRSNWAFLNEPTDDEISPPSNKYASQFHVAQMATKKCSRAN